MTTTRAGRPAWATAGRSACGLALAAAAAASVIARPPQMQQGVFASGDIRLIDFPMFANAGNQVGIVGWGAVYADPALQAGPAQVMTDGWLWSAARAMSPWGWWALQFVVSLTFIVAVFFAARVLYAAIPGAATSGRDTVLGRWLLPLGAALTVTWLEVTSALYVWGHWWHVLVVGAWWAAGVLAARGHPLWAGLIVGMTTWWEPFGVLGVVVLLLAPRWRSAVAGAFTAAAASLAVWVPLALQPEFAMHKMTWGVTQESLWRPFVGDTMEDLTVDWKRRVIQVGITVAVTAAVAVWLRRRRVVDVWAAFAVATVAVLARVASDFGAFPYYLIPTVAAAAAATAALAAARRALPAAAAGIWLVLTVFVTLPWVPQARALAAIPAVVVAVAGIRRPAPAALPGDGEASDLDTHGGVEEGVEPGWEPIPTVAREADPTLAGEPT